MVTHGLQPERVVHAQARQQGRRAFGMVQQRGALVVAGRRGLARELVLHRRERHVHRQRGHRQRVVPVLLPARQHAARQRDQHAHQQRVAGAVVLEFIAGVVGQARQRAVGVALDQREHVVAQRAQAHGPVGAAGVGQQQAQAHLQVGPVQRTIGRARWAAVLGQRLVVAAGVGDAAQGHVLAQHLVELARVGALNRLGLHLIDEDGARTQQLKLFLGLDGRPAREQHGPAAVAHGERQRATQAQAIGGEGNDLHESSVATMRPL